MVHQGGEWHSLRKQIIAAIRSGFDGPHLSATYTGMARLDEIAEGLATVLQVSQTPEPLGVDLWGHSPAEVTFLVRALVDACERRLVPLARVRVAIDFASNVSRALGPEPLQYESVEVELAADLDHRIELYRFRSINIRDQQ